MKHHELKIKECFFKSILIGDKTCEIRLDDRDFQAGDTIRFLPFNEVCEPWIDVNEFEVSHVLRYPQGLKKGYVALSIKKINYEN